MTGRVRRIPLHAKDGTIRAYALVDEEDFRRFGALAWSLHSDGYAYRWEPGRPRRCVLLHRAVLGLKVGDPRRADHRDRDRLNCTRGNLRVTTAAGNAQNRVGTSGTSRFRGVSLYKKTGQFEAALTVDGRRIRVGFFVEELAAAVAVEARRRELMPFAEPDPELVRALA